MIELQDKHERNEIINNLDTNFIIDAGAGSGKTTALVDRIFSLIIKKRVSLSEIVIITFTNKSAQELKERVQKKFLNLLKQNINSNLKKYLNKAFNDFSLMYIGTIHSFCVQILKEFPVEAGVDISFETLDDSETDLIKAKVWQNFLIEIFYKYKEYYSFLLEYNINEEKLFYFYNLRCKYPDIIFRSDDISEPDINYIYEKMYSLIDEIEPFMPDTVRDTLCEFINEFKEYSRHTIDKKKKIDLILSLNKAEIKVKSWPDLKQAKYIKKDILQFFKKDILEPFIKDIKAYSYKQIINILNCGFEEYVLYKKQNNYLDFSDLLMKASQIIKEKSFVRKYLQFKYKYIFVDEFQDTDPLQTELILYLTSSLLEEKDWRCVSANLGSLFVVGDPKQSIYRFRRADINIYNIAKDIIKKTGKELELTMNFRACPEIINWVNNTFSQNIFFPNETNNYQTHFVSMNPNSKDKGRLKKFSYLDKMNADDIATVNANEIAEYIKEEILSGRRKESDFLIILFYKNRMNVYVRALEKLNIKYNSSGDLQVSESIILRDIKRIFKLLANPCNEMLCYGVLRSSLFGFSDAELAEYRMLYNGRFELSGCQDDAKNRKHACSEEIKISDCLKMLNGYKKLFKQYPPAAAFKKIIEDLDVFGLVSLLKNSFFEFSLIKNLIENVFSQEFSKYNDLSGLVDFLEDLITNEKLTKTEFDLKENNRVRIMNLHQAKGLEAPVVILANPRGKTAVKPNFHTARDTGQGFFSLASKGILAEPLNWKEYEKEEQSFLDAEYKRLLYVAVTRAKQELIFTYDPNEKYRNPWALLNEFIEGVEEVGGSNQCSVISNQCSEGKGSNQYLEGKEKGEINHGDNINKNKIENLNKPTYKIKTVTGQGKGEGGSGNGEINHGNKINKNKIETKSYGTEFGTMVHKILDYIIVNRQLGSLQLEEYINTIYNEEHTKLNFSAKFLLEHINKIMESNFFKQILNSDERYSEVPFMSGIQNKYIKGVIDLIYKKEGKWYLVDYKTDNFSKQDLKIYTDKYILQILAYKKYWEQITCQEISEAYIYFTFLDIQVTI